MISGDVVEEITKLKAGPGGDLLVAGSAQLVHALTAADLVDEYRLMVFPLLLGSGKRVFDAGEVSQHLQLVDSRRAGDVVLLTLHPKRDV